MSHTIKEIAILYGASPRTTFAHIKKLKDCGKFKPSSISPSYNDKDFLKIIDLLGIDRESNKFRRYKRG